MVSGKNPAGQLRAIHAKSKSPGHVRTIGNQKYRYKSVRMGDKVKSIYVGKIGPA